jgi:hypothetical protein
MSGPRRIFGLALVAVALAAFAGCGGDEEGKGIPAATAGTLNAQLQKVQDRISQGSVGACKDILDAPEERGPNKQQVQNAIDSLPDDVDSDVKSALQDSFDHLWDLVDEECQNKESEQKQNTTPTDTTEETTPAETEPETETNTTPTQEETTPTAPTTPSDEELPGGEGNGNGNGNGGGGGGGLPGAGNGGGVGPSGEEADGL